MSENKMNRLEEEIKKAKEWFGNGEVDVELMLSTKAITIEEICRMYRREVLDLHIVRDLTDTTETHVTHMIFCPGCKCGHGFDSRWTFNGNYEKPTFSPSMLVNQHTPERRCHSFVVDGKIRFLDDCFHDLKGKLVDLEEF